MDYEGLGQRVKALRRARGYTQEELAKRVGLSLSFLGHIERGSRKASIDTLVKLACTLEVGTDELLQDSMPHAIAERPVKRKVRVPKMDRMTQSTAPAARPYMGSDLAIQNELEEQENLLQSICLTLGLPLD